jgi:hypothetical protein
MIEIKDVKIDGLHCYEVTVLKYYHGPTHRPTVKAKLGLTVDGRPVGNMEIEDLPDDLEEPANALLAAVEKVMLDTVSVAEGSPTETAASKPKGIIEEF